MIRVFLFLCLCTLLPGVLSISQAQELDDPLEQGFRDVPSDARLHLFWRIFGPAWDRAEIDYQLGLLQQAHVGGVMTCFTYPAALDDPDHAVHNGTFLSPDFLDTLRYAAQQSREHALEFGLCGGSGWPYGGPNVSLRDSAQQLRRVTLAPLPEHGGYSLPELRIGEHYLAAFCGRKDLTNSIRGDRLRTREEGPCQLFINGPTYMKVKRPALGGEGYVVDHLNRNAVQRYLTSTVEPLLNAAPGAIHTLFCDSLEVYNANWTPELPVQFHRRRGYDLIPHLPEMFDDASPAAPGLRFDYWRTVAEMAEQEFVQTVQAFCRQHNVEFALEAYGTPPMGFTAAQQCDVPWGEQYEWQGFSFSRFAASGAHLAGKKIIGAEAWTWVGIPNRLADSLADLKLCSDLHFLAGENQLTGVEFPYSPRSAGAPGWLPYYGPALNQNNPQWNDFHYLADYVNRCQWLLRQGDPVADVALYTPTEDAFAGGPIDQMLLDFKLRDRLGDGMPGEEFGLQRSMTYRSPVISSLLQSGYNYDGIDFFAMNALARAEGGELRAGDGRYRIVVLPGLIGIDLRAMEKMAQMCRQGGVVIATGRLPDRVYGLNQEAATARLRELIGEMFGPDAYAQNRTNGSVTVHDYGSGRAIIAADADVALRQALAQLAAGDGRFDPDVRPWIFAPDVRADADIMHVHRHVGDRDFYFVVNLSDRQAQFGADFRAAGKAITRWDPLTGAILPCQVDAGGKSDQTRFTTVYLTLPPHGSTFVCFAPGPSAPRPERTPTIERARPLDMAWHIVFEGPNAPPPYDTRELTSWTGWPGAKFFSGQAAYECRFTMPSRLPRRCLLRFDRVHEVGEVEVNGVSAGAVWLPPYEIDVTSMITSGENRLRVTVANLPVNRVLGQPAPDLKPLRAAYGDRFPDPQETRIMSAPAPSGLIGAVTLITQD